MLLAPPGIPWSAPAVPQGSISPPSVVPGGGCSGDDPRTSRFYLPNLRGQSSFWCPLVFHWAPLGLLGVDFFVLSGPREILGKVTGVPLTKRSRVELLLVPTWVPWGAPESPRMSIFALLVVLWGVCEKPLGV